MERESKKYGDGDSAGEQIELSIWESIQQIARRDARASLDTEESTIKFLVSWWCKRYNRPMKDPLLKEYTPEELAYEYYNITEREAFAAELRQKEQDKIEEEKWDEAEDWADKMEKEEAEAKAQKDKEYNPLEDPEEIKWMEEQIRKDKERFGDNFGEDLSVSFEDE